MEVKLQDPSFIWNPSKALVMTPYGFSLAHALRKFAKTICLPGDLSLHSHFPVTLLLGLACVPMATEQFVFQWLWNNGYGAKFLRFGSLGVALEIHLT